MTNLIFEKYPYLNNLRLLISEDLILKEVREKIDEFEVNIKTAKKNIPEINLNQLFPPELENSPIYLQNFLGHWGNLSIEELCKICLIVSYFKPKSVLEIGTYNGMTTLQIALNAPTDCTTYTLDLPSESNHITQFPTSTIDRYVINEFRDRFGTSTGSYFKNRNDLKIVQLYGDSVTFNYQIIENPVDIILIDAAHDFKSKKIDSENAFKLISEGGVIIWDNYNDVLNPDVTKCLLEISKDYQLFHLRNTMLVVYWNKCS
jgi:predicted O-methyltransferase YrrM